MVRRLTLVVVVLVALSGSEARAHHKAGHGSGPSPSPSPSPMPSPSPTPTATPTPTPSPTPAPSPTPSPAPSPTASPVPSSPPEIGFSGVDLQVHAEASEPVFSELVGRAEWVARCRVPAVALLVPIVRDFDCWISEVHVYTVRNLGTVTAPDVVVNVEVERFASSGAQHRATASQGSCQSAWDIVCSLGPLEPGAEATVTVRFGFWCGNAGFVSSLGEARSSQSDDNPADNRAGAVTPTASVCWWF